MMRALPLCLLLALVGCESHSEAIDASARHAGEDNYYQAYQDIKEARQRDPESQDLERLYWLRRKQYLLERGRQRIFEEHEREGIGDLEKVLALDPQNRSAKRWIQRAKEKLAARAVNDGEEALNRGRLDQAMVQFQEALSCVPEYPLAVEGQKRVAEIFSKRHQQATDHFTKGSRAWVEQLFRQSRYQDGLAVRKDPSLEQAERRRKQASKRLAKERFARAKEMEAKGYFGAALTEYEAIQRLHKLSGIDERIAAVRKEVAAAQKVRAASMAMRRDKFEIARKLLNEAFELGELQRGDISALMIDVKKRRYEADYRKAKDLEIEAKYEAALKLYKTIDKAWPSRGFLDVRTRVSGLETDLAAARKLKAAGDAALAKGDKKAAAQAYGDALDVLRGFAGLDVKIRELQAAATTKQ